jgi:hypothetical protein
MSRDDDGDGGSGRLKAISLARCALLDMVDAGRNHAVAVRVLARGGKVCAGYGDDIGRVRKGPPVAVVLVELDRATLKGRNLRIGRKATACRSGRS